MAPNWQTVIPAGFTDSSWHNDTCPSISDDARGIVVYIDYSDVSKREMQHKGTRFYVADIHSEEMLETNDWKAVLDFVNR